MKSITKITEIKQKVVRIFRRKSLTSWKEVNKKRRIREKTLIKPDNWQIFIILEDLGFNKAFSTMELNVAVMLVMHVPLNEIIKWKRPFLQVFLRRLSFVYLALNMWTFLPRYSNIHDWVQDQRLRISKSKF